MIYHKKRDLLLLATKLTKKITDATNAKQYCHSYLKRKNTKLVKASKIFTQQPNIFENPNTVDIKSVTIQHPKTSHKLSRSIRQAKKVSQVSGAGR